MPSAESRAWERGPRRPGVLAQLRAFFRHWHVFLFLVRYNIKNAYQRAILGVLWLFIRPLVMVVGATLLVRDILGIGTDMAVPYPLFVLCGISAFILFSRGTAWQTRLLYKLRRIMTACYIPRLVHYYSSLAPALVEFLVVFFCFMLGLGWFAFSTGELYLGGPAQLLMAVPSLMLLVLWSQVITLITSVLQLYAKDTWLTLRYVMPALMLITPIFYPVAELPIQFQPYLFFNPLAAPVLMYQWALLDLGTAPWNPFFLSFVAACLCYVGSLKFFVYWEGQALDEYV